MLEHRNTSNRANDRSSWSNFKHRYSGGDPERKSALTTVAPAGSKWVGTVETVSSPSVTVGQGRWAGDRFSIHRPCSDRPSRESKTAASGSRRWELFYLANTARTRHRDNAPTLTSFVCFARRLLKEKGLKRRAERVEKWTRPSIQAVKTFAQKYRCGTQCFWFQSAHDANQFRVRERIEFRFEMPIRYSKTKAHLSPALYLFLDFLFYARCLKQLFI